MVYFVFIRNKGLFKVFAVTQQTAHLGNDASSRDSRRAFSVAGPTVWNSPGFYPGPDHQCRLF